VVRTRAPPVELHPFVRSFSDRLFATVKGLDYLGEVRKLLPTPPLLLQPRGAFERPSKFP